ncbi:uncharacterized protein TRAVEDRAFT_48424 [Trametes versicolor FP-101664 SS1]|uniref:uncharacterized protein n=1 Tax=Trametes versicolor (strain FP-101664) TaxID=717944 RepID=UPI00046238B3|nr:uncharacterized protein TRAVEDRAFT_48424 [Trametes versicolor FP-101664 SS1]EIW57385.1 hypothetical protein TRAVEDRAFT_48424 [Trametes versicolor FP-101664 SS1]
MRTSTLHGQTISEYPRGPHIPPADATATAAAMRLAAARLSVAPLALPSPEHELTDPMRGFTATIPGSHPHELFPRVDTPLLSPNTIRKTRLSSFWQGTQDVEDAPAHPGTSLATIQASPPDSIAGGEAQEAQEGALAGDRAGQTSVGIEMSRARKCGLRSDKVEYEGGTAVVVRRKKSKAIESARAGWVKSSRAAVRSSEQSPTSPSSMHATATLTWPLSPSGETDPRERACRRAACRSPRQTSSFASTVRPHAYVLSPARFAHLAAIGVVEPRAKAPRMHSISFASSEWVLNSRARGLQWYTR